MTPSTARRALAGLVADGRAREYPAGRGRRYFAPERGGRPDLGMPPRVDALEAHVGPAEAEAIGRSLARDKVLGLIGERERFESAALQHRLVLVVAFEEVVPAPALSRLFGAHEDERVGEVYLHPREHRVLLFDNETGIRFEAVPGGHASDLRGLDGVAPVRGVRPAELRVDPADWLERAGDDEVRARFAERFGATPGRVAPLFVPLYELTFAGARGARRRVRIDALVGRPVRWPA